MIKKTHQPLIKTNPYLRDPQKRQNQFVRAVVTSSKIEGVTITPKILKHAAKTN
jgi:hypothetical protein